MGRVIALAGLLLASQAFGAANDLTIEQRNSTDSGYVRRFLANPGQDALVSYCSTSVLPCYTTIGSGLTLSGGVLTANAPAWTSITSKPEWLSAFDGSYDTLTNRPSLAAVAISGNYADLNNKPPARSISYTTRSLNTCFQPSATRDALVSYSIDIQTTMSLTTGQQGTVYLEIFTDSSCTTGAQEVTRFVNGQIGTLTIGLSLTQNVTGTLTGVIPAGAYVKLRTQNNTGTPTFTARPGQETLL